MDIAKLDFKDVKRIVAVKEVPEYVKYSGVVFDRPFTFCFAGAGLGKALQIDQLLPIQFNQDPEHGFGYSRYLALLAHFSVFSVTEMDNFFESLEIPVQRVVGSSLADEDEE